AVQEALFFVFMLFWNAHDIDAGTLANIHRPLQLKHEQRLTHNGSAHAIGFSDIALRRQAGANGIVTLDNLRAQILANLLVLFFFRWDNGLIHNITCAYFSVNTWPRILPASLSAILPEPMWFSLTSIPHQVEA